MCGGFFGGSRSRSVRGGRCGSGFVAAALEEAGVAVEAAEGVLAAAARASEVDTRLVGGAACIVGRPARGARHDGAVELVEGEREGDGRKVHFGSRLRCNGDVGPVTIQR
jgi:hypothetical protein